MNQQITFRPLSDGKGSSLLSASPLPDLAAAGYTDTEYAASGVARRLVGDADAPARAKGQIVTDEGDGGTKIADFLASKKFV